MNLNTMNMKQAYIFIYKIYRQLKLLLKEDIPLIYNSKCRLDKDF